MAIDQRLIVKATWSDIFDEAIRYSLMIYTRKVRIKARDMHKLWDRQSGLCDISHARMYIPGVSPLQRPDRFLSKDWMRDHRCTLGLRNIKGDFDKQNTFLGIRVLVQGAADCTVRYALDSPVLNACMKMFWTTFKPSPWHKLLRITFKPNHYEDYSTRKMVPQYNMLYMRNGGWALLCKLHLSSTGDALVVSTNRQEDVDMSISLTSPNFAQGMCEAADTAIRLTLSSYRHEPSDER